MSDHLDDDESNGNLCEALGKLSVKSDDSNKTTKPPPNLSDMPNEVISLIIEKSEYKEQLILRKVSKLMRTLVDRSKPACVELYISYNSIHIRCYYNNDKVLYAADENNHPLYYYDPDVKVIRDDYENVALDDLKWTLNNPKLQLDTLYYIYYYDEGQPMEITHSVIDSKMETILKSLNHQLSVKRIEIEYYHASTILAILPHLKPGVLETIYLVTKVDDSDTNSIQNIEQISSFDQWKQAQELKLYNIVPINLMEYTTHFKRFEFELFEFTEAQLIILRNHFSRMNNFEYCEIQCYDSFDMDSMVMAVGLPAPPYEENEYVSHYSIPDSNDYLEFQFFYDKIIIKKKNRLSSQS